jgi:hypothetical protein
MKTQFVMVLCVGTLAFLNGMSASSDVITPRWGHTVTELPDGRHLIAGGENENGLVAEIEILDFGLDAPTGNITVSAQVVGTLSSPRRRHAAVRLNDGRVLLSGGEGASGILGSAELIDPATGAVTQISLGGPRADHTASLLSDGTVLLAGGHDGTSSLASLQIISPATNTITGPSAGPQLAAPRHQHTATLLDDGRLLLVGGRNSSGALATTEYWDQATGTVTAGPLLSEARFGHTATKIPRGYVAVVGGSDVSAPLATVEVFFAGADVFAPGGSLAVPRTGHSAVALPDNGHLMVLGGRSADGPVAAVELMDPYRHIFTFLSTLAPSRAESAAAIAGPYVWAVGGRSPGGGALGSVAAVRFATLTSDHTSFSPNSTVTLQGDFWLPGEVVTITVASPDNGPATSATSVADADGRFVNTDFATGNDLGIFIATASGAQSGSRAALEFEVSTPPSSPSLATRFSPSEFTQTTSPVTLTIFGGGFIAPSRVVLLMKSSTCGVRALGICIKRIYVSEYAATSVRVRSRRDATQIITIDPTAVFGDRVVVVLPAAVTSNIGDYDVAVGERRITVQTSSWFGFIPGGTSIDHRHVEGEFFGPLTVLAPDFTPPEIVLTVDSSALVNGWYTGDVSVTWSVSDPESSISARSGCEDVRVVTDTAGTTFTCSATSRGGTKTQSVTIKRDASPPDATLSIVEGTAGSNGWYVSPVTVRTTGSDSMSAPVTCTADKVQNADTTGSQFTGSCTNAANLTKEATPLLIKVDKTAPTISAAALTAPNAAGWYQGNVTVAFTCMDATSGIATCPPSQTLSAEGASASASQVAIDAAGRTSAPSNIVAVKIDRTAPTVALSGGPANGGSYYFGQVPAAPACSGSDGLSGLESCTISGYGTTVGSHTVLATARDRAGNASVQSATYTVLPWTFAGFHHPVAMGDVVNTVKGGATVPITFEVFAGPTELVDTAAVNQPLMAMQSVCGSAETSDIELLATGDTSLRYDAATGQFVYNWKTPRLAGYCYVVTVTLKDGTSRSAQFGLK